MKSIVYIGNFRHPWCTEVHITRDLESLGHTVTRLQEPPGGHGGHLFLREILVAAEQANADLVMFTRTWGLHPDATQTWRTLEANGVVTASYHLDLYVPLPRRASIENDPFWTTQYVFTADGDPTSQEWFDAHNINHHYSPPAVVSDECVEGTRRDRYDYPIIFVGSGSNYHPEWRWRQELLGWLTATYGDKFRRFGGDQPEGPTRGQDLNDLYATARVVVGDTLSFVGHTRYFSDRLFETIGRGGFLVFPRIDGLDELGFVDGEHFRLYDFGDLDGLRVIIDYYIDNPDAAREIALKGQAFVRENHTYAHRLAAALDVMFTNPTASTAAYRLELGSGYHPTPGFVHLDVNPNAPDVDIVGPMWPLNIPNGSVSEIRAVDVVEHDHYTHTEPMLTEWARVCAPGARVYIQVPDCETIMRWFVNEPHLLVERIPKHLPQTPISGAQWRIMGGGVDGTYAQEGDDWRWNWHAAMFSKDSLVAALDKAGFDIESIETNPHPNLMCWAVKR